MLGTGIKMGITSDRMQCHFICYIQPFAATNCITNVPQVGKYRKRTPANAADFKNSRKHPLDFRVTIVSIAQMSSAVLCARILLGLGLCRIDVYLPTIPVSTLHTVQNFPSQTCSLKEYEREQEQGLNARMRFAVI